MLRFSSLVVIFLSFILASTIVFSANNEKRPAITHEIPIKNIEGYSTYPDIVKKIISISLSLSQKNFTYSYGSADPKNGGMDCSGTMYYILQKAGGSDVPRSSDEMYAWVKSKGKLYSTSSNDFNSPEFANLQPGDLLFWSGTYVKPSASITHVMLYLGKNNKGAPIMFGSSDGRTYENKKMWGVSVFDFKLPSSNEKAKFVGYGCIPAMTC